MDLGKRLKNLRKSQGKTLRQVADKIGISDAYVSKIENNKVDPSIKTLQRLADYYRVDLVHLLSDKHSWYKILPPKLQNCSQESLALELGRG